MSRETSFAEKLPCLFEKFLSECLNEYERFNTDVSQQRDAGRGNCEDAGHRIKCLEDQVATLRSKLEESREEVARQESKIRDLTLQLEMRPSRVLSRSNPIAEPQSCMWNSASSAKRALDENCDDTNMENGHKRFRTLDSVIFLIEIATGMYTMH
jgi:hypothetical protein